MGTDYATSLFYSGEIDRRLKQVDVVIAKFPDFQSAYFNKGNYLAHKGRIAEQDGDTKARRSGDRGGEGRLHQGGRHRRRARTPARPPTSSCRP